MWSRFSVLLCTALVLLIAPRPLPAEHNVSSEADLLSVGSSMRVNKDASSLKAGNLRAGSSSGDYAFLKIAETGDPPPDRPASAFQVFTDPSINNAGQVAFDATFTESTASAIEGVYKFLGTGLVRLADNGEFGLPPPPGEVTGNFSGFSRAVINNAGEILFHGGTEFSDSEHGVYVYTNPLTGGLIFNDSMSQPVPGQPGESFLVFPFLNFDRVLLSDTGHSATIAQWRDAGFVPHAGLYYGDVAGGIVRIADDSVAPPGQPGSLFTGPPSGNPPTPSSAFDAFMCMNNQGDVAFNAAYDLGTGSGMYRYVGVGATLLRVADSSMQPPGQSPGATFSTVFNFPSMNNLGTVAFKSRYVGGSGNEGLYLGNGVSALQLVVDNSGAFAVPGQPTAGYLAFEPPVINDAGLVVFGAALTGSSAGGGLYKVTGGLIEKIVDFSDPVPGQPGANFNALDHFVLNASGHVLFRGRYTGDNFGLYFYDGSTVSRVIDTSQTLDLLGTAYTRFSILFGFGGTGGEDGKPRPMNDINQIVFRTHMANQNFDPPQGIFMALPPQPCGIPDVGIEMVAVGDPGNAADTNGFGAVNEIYRIGLFELTNEQYVEFLNAVAADDPNGLYDTVMTTSLRGGIIRSGAPGSFTYTLKPNFGNKPASGFCWTDGARFCNWLHNGKPVGPQGPATTEDGAYDISLPIDQISRKPGARFFIPSNDEWYKAAYYDPFDPGADGSGTPDYWFYPTSSDVFPTQAIGDLNVGDVINPGPNVANYERGVDWNGTDCSQPGEVCGNVSTVGSCGSVSPWGCFDAGGNIYEWLEELGMPISGPPPLPTRMARGGDFANGGVLMRSNLVIDVNMQSGAANFGMRIAAVFNPCAGDINCDNFVDINDVPAFVQALIDESSYRSSFQGCDISVADMSGNGTVGGEDIQPFVDLLTGI